MSTTIIENAIEATAVAAELRKAKAKTIVGKFMGSFGGFMTTCFLGLKSYGFTDKESHLIASDFGNDVARAQTENAKLKAKVDKAKEDGQTRFAFSGKSDFIKMTYAMELDRLCTLLEKAKDEKIVEKRSFPPREHLKVELREYLDSVGERVKATEWAE